MTDSAPEQTTAECEPAPQPEYSEDGVDLSLIRWFVSLAPAERLKFHQGWINGIQRIRALNDID